MATPLSTKTKYLLVVWRPAEEDALIDEKVSGMLAYLKERAETYALAVHDLDTDANGDRMTSHIHVVAVMEQCRALQTWLNEIADALGVDTLSVSVDKASSVKRSIRYLIHKDDPEKHQYPLGSIIHNWADAELLAVFADKEKTEITYEYIARLCQRCARVSEIVSVIGMGAYRYWRPVILDIWRDYHADTR